MKCERGDVSIELPLALGFVLLPIALLVIALPIWPERQTMARSAANEVARTMALAESWDDGLVEATDVVERAARNAGIDTEDVSVTVDGGLLRGSTLTANVTVTMPALRIPGVTTVGSWSWTASHSERVEDYRSIR